MSNYLKKKCKKIKSNNSKEKIKDEILTITYEQRNLKKMEKS